MLPERGGRQYGSHYPKLKTYPKQGTWGYYLSHGSDPKTANGPTSAKPDSPPTGSCLSNSRAEDQAGQGHLHRAEQDTLAEYAPEALARRRTTGFGLKPATAANYER
jgi:hypothetical protein